MYAQSWHFLNISGQKKITLSLLSKTTKIKRHKVIVLQISENKMLIKYQKQWRMEIITEHKTQRLLTLV